jgi:leucyl-tRNA synthetase
MGNKDINYNPKDIEPKWQQIWEDDELYRSVINPEKEKYYALTMLPYPSGDLHIGHWYAMTPSDARARYMRMRGYNVMFPMGFDAFGLPAENAAIRRGIHPKEWTYRNIDKMRDQLRTMGAMFDWHREAISSDPGYYRWTQWFFIQLYRNGLAYRKLSPVDWCPNCNTTLAREQVWGDDRHCERCDTPVVKKELNQWFFKITNYADELLDFSFMDWPDRVRSLQENWIGRSEGARVYFSTENGDLLEVFTTRPDTLWGATFMVLAPEHHLVQKITPPENQEKVSDYIQQTIRQTDIQREALDKEKTGVFTGGYAINPVNNRKIPIWIADYVLMTYGTGAIMAVPAHDERDFEFAIKFGLPILPVIERPDGISKSFVVPGSMDPGFAQEVNEASIPFKLNPDNSIEILIPAEKKRKYSLIAQKHIQPGYWNEVVGTAWEFIFEDEIISWNSPESEFEIFSRCKSLNPKVANSRTLMEMLWGNEFYQDTLFHHNYGRMIHSEAFSGTEGDVAVRKVTEWLEHAGIGKRAVNYRLRDWLISRQRYWGAPIPMIHCSTCGWQPVPEDQLPVLLPDDVEWKPTGESPLKLHTTWKLTNCPICNEPAVRETDTMDTFMCSSWYHLRYLSPSYNLGPFDPVEYKYWMPVDVYTGGIEHATMHLIYTRFFHKACRDMGITTGPEPMLKLRNQGMVLGEDNEKMSKSRGNVISPDDLVALYGADTVRAYLMFFARWDMGGPWNSNGIEGTARWLKRVWSLFLNTGKAGNADHEAKRHLRRKVHQTLKKITNDFDTLEFNTIISGLMELLNDMYRAKDAGATGTPEWDEAINYYLRMMAPVTPHVAEELWMRLSLPYSIHNQPWPEVDEEAIKLEETTIVLQVNGKVRDRITVPIYLSETEIKSLALESDTIKRYIRDAIPRKIIYVPGKLLNIVI